MTRTPWLLRQQRHRGKQLGDIEAEDILLMRSPLAHESIAKYVGEESLARGVDREAQDEWALHSHQKYFAAHDAGRIAEELVPVPGSLGMPLLVDEQARRDTSLDQLASLHTVYGSKTVTAGNAPGLNDGAVALVVMSESRAAAEGIKPLARVVSTASISGSPTSSVYLPAEAIARVLQDSRYTVMDLTVLEINEAFAATTIVSIRELAGDSEPLRRQLWDRTNVNGGAVAIGHPVGASGARIVLSAILEARRRGGGPGVAAICGGFGQADAILFETL
jgi:acetyl-CoA C-acetyltransferase